MIPFREPKHRHGYDVTATLGLIGMQMQATLAIFTVNPSVEKLP